MTVLHLGVLDIPYTDTDQHKPKKVAKAKRGKANKPRKIAVHVSSETTGDVADILEDKYHVMEVFFREHEQPIADALAHGLAGSIENLLAGGSAQNNPFGTAEAEMDEAFKLWLEQGEMEKLGFPGVPTEAAKKGVNHRLAHPYAKANPRRPSFIDTGLYSANFKAWVDR